MKQNCEHKFNSTVLENFKNVSQCGSTCLVTSCNRDGALFSISIKDLCKGYIVKCNEYNRNSKSNDSFSPLSDQKCVLTAKWEYLSGGLLTLFVILFASHFLLICLCPIKPDIARDNSEIPMQNRYHDQSQINSQPTAPKIDQVYATVNKIRGTETDVEEMYAKVDKHRVTETEEIYANTEGINAGRL